MSLLINVKMYKFEWFYCFLKNIKVATSSTCIPSVFVDSISSCLSVQKKICILSKTKPFLFYFFIKYLTLPFIPSGKRKTSTSSVSFRGNNGFIFHTFVRKTKVTTYEVPVKSLIFYVSCLNILLNLKWAKVNIVHQRKNLKADVTNIVVSYFWTLQITSSEDEIQTKGKPGRGSGTDYTLPELSIALCTN